ncbi:MAG TPA: nuclear transport factor 2 family protein [Bryobacteraceae bacterium]|nr:nuclear transport factor 2 family protein [Bryobacteraceae bacterium]
MPGPSSSQELELEYVIWNLPDSSPVAIQRRVQDRIHQEVNEAFAAAPHRGAETGGILLGHREADRIVVEDFEPVPSEHSFGPGYTLSQSDRQLLQETLEWFRSGAQPGLSVLGFYRSHPLPDFALREDDEDLMRAYFAEGEDIVLLVRPSLRGTNAEDFCLRRSGRACTAAPFNSPVLSWPPPRPRMEPEPEQPAGKRWFWYAAAIALGLLGGAVGYVLLHPTHGATRPPVSAASPAALAAPAAGPAQPAVEGSRAPQDPDVAGIHELLNRWSGALKRGDVDAAAQCYAPVVTTYFARHDVPRAVVRQTIRQARARYGRLEVYRLSAVNITPVGDNRAVATFRKQWKMAGRARSAGSEAERMTLVRNDGAWRISSEQPELGALRDE